MTMTVSNKTADEPVLPDDAATLVVSKTQNASQTSLPPKESISDHQQATRIGRPLHDHSNYFLLAKPDPDIGKALAGPAGELTKSAMDALRVKFAEEWNTHPSDPEWIGLQDIALAIEGMADGTLLPKFYLSSLAPGVGKTSAVCFSLRKLVAMEQYKEISAVIFLSRYEEISHLVEDMKLKETDYAVLVSEKAEQKYREMNKWGTGIPNTGRVLFTTQQRLEGDRNRGKKFAEISEFHFQGKPRAIKIWDETICPSQTIAVGQDDISGLLKECRPNSLAVAAALEALIDMLRKVPDRAVVAPRLHELVDLETFRSWFASGEDKDTAEALWRLSDKPVNTRKDGVSGSTMLDYEEILPDDFAPLLILDASGLQRETYKLWAEGRGGLYRLYSPPKDFTPFLIGHWDRGAGKSGSLKQKRKKWNEIADGVAAKIDELPKGDEILVVHFKNVDMPRYVVERIGDNPRVHFVTWGQHTATNDFKDCKHVILAGVLQYSTSGYEAIGRGAKRIIPFRQLLDTDHRKIRLGEIAHNILQAACRGMVRKSDGNKCPEGCSLWIIYSAHHATGVPRELLTKVFPGATVKDWISKARKKNTIDRAIEWIAKQDDRLLTANEVADAIGYDRDNFNGRIRKRRDIFQEGLAAIGRKAVWHGHRKATTIEVTTR